MVLINKSDLCLKKEKMNSILMKKKQVVIKFMFPCRANEVYT